jgi:hypothetical protein
VEGPSLHDKGFEVERRSLHYAALRAAPVGTTGQVQGPSLHDRGVDVERRSLNYAALRAAPVGTTGQVRDLLLTIAG